MTPVHRNALLWRTSQRLSVALLILAAALSSTSVSSAEKLRIATLVPKRSSWGKVVHVWQKAMKARTKGKLELEVYYNGVQGMEDGMVAKMRTGQLDGAFLSSAGLSTIYRDVMVLQLPGMIQDWKTLDSVRSALDSTLRKGFAAAGFSLLGWSDVGHVREFSRGFVARRPDDIKGHRPLVWRNDPITPTIYATIGGVVPSPLSPGEVLPALRTGKVDYLLAPAVAAEQLQWTPYLDYVTSDVTACAIGGTVMKTSQLDALPPDLRTAFSELTVKMAKAQTARVRKDDAASFARVSRISKVITLSPSDRAAWNAVWRKAIQRLTQGTFPKPLVDEVTKLAGRKGA